LVRVREVSVAALAALTVSIGLCAWVMQGGKPADAAARADTPSEPAVATAPAASFMERFSTFEDRFGPATPAGNFVMTTGSIAPAAPAVDSPPAASPAELVAPARAPRLASLIPLPRPAPRPRTAAPYRVASLTDVPAPAGAPAEATPNDSGIAGFFKRLTRDPPSEPVATDAAPADAAPKEVNPLEVDPAHTAIYDISARTLYLPTGERLEAHSGLGGYMDDVHSVSLKSRGATPPNVYDLKLRETLFHGVRAIRMVPADGSKMYGRDGMLVHPFMLGPEGQSNGCVSLKDYPTFLKAYERGDITRLVVVEQLDDPPGGRTPSEWFSSTFKRIFSRS
jgi:hypothetical protein